MRISDWGSDVCSSDLPSAFRADLVAIADALAEAGGGLLASSGALGRLIRDVDTFGFHLATLDLRQNADVHERVVDVLLKVAGVERGYGDLSTATPVALLRREMAGWRRLDHPLRYLD